MKKILIVLVVAFFATNGSVYAQKGKLTPAVYSKFKDSRDASMYKYVKIGQQVWMAENLAYKPNISIKTGKTNIWAYSNDDANVAKYGYLYTHETAKNVCPDGWKLPSKEDYKLMLKSIEDENGISYNNILFNIYKIGFSVLFSGVQHNSGSFMEIEKGTRFWASTPNITDYAIGLRITKGYENSVQLNPERTDWGLSVRCVKE